MRSSFLILLALAVFIGGGYLVSLIIQGVVDGQGRAAGSQMDKVYLSLAPQDGNEYSHLTIYSYDVETGELTQEIADTGNDYLTSKISPDGTQIAFSRTPTEGGDVALFVSDRAMTEMAEIETAENLVIKRSPTWSPDGTQIAFQGSADINGSNLAIENWGIYLHNRITKDTSRITAGVNPIFLPDGTLAVLKKDGIYLIRPEDNSETLVLEVTGGSASANMAFDISRDGKKIVWVVPNNSEIHLIDVSSWTPFTITGASIIPVSAFWPIFSPDGNHIAMEVFEWEGEGDARTAAYQRLSFFSLEDQSWSTPFDLMPFHKNAIYISDWR